MALKRLTTGEMVSLTASWTQKNGPDRQVLAGVPAVAALFPQIDDAHHDLVHTQAQAAPPARIGEIQDEQKKLDVRHDDILRGSFALPQALAYLTKDASVAHALLELQHVLLPDGLTATQKSYRDEAGQAKLLKSRLTPDQVALLKKIQTMDGTLWESVSEWTSIAAKLGKLEDERAALEQGNGTVPADVVVARNKWIRVVNAVRNILDVVGAGDEKVTALLQRIDAAERKADRRTAAGGTDTTPGDTTGNTAPAAGDAKAPAAGAAPAGGG